MRSPSQATHTNTAGQLPSTRFKALPPSSSFWASSQGREIPPTVNRQSHPRVFSCPSGTHSSSLTDSAPYFCSHTQVCQLPLG